MRTTLSLADDVLAAAKAIACAQDRTVGDVISDLARRSLQRPARTLTTRNGLPLLPVQTPGALVSMEIINGLRNEEL